MCTTVAVVCRADAAKGRQDSQLGVCVIVDIRRARDLFGGTDAAFIDLFHAFVAGQCVVAPDNPVESPPNFFEWRSSRVRSLCRT